jgi:dGTPase
MGYLDEQNRSFATHISNMRGRLYSEREIDSRTPFQRDRDRIIHSTAFRRLQYKTQVFVYHEGDHYRTRLTHSLEVAQIARSISRALGLNEDLAEALALAHDLGHTPFGHAGEDILQELMADYGGFDHNAQTLRILTKLETRYAAFEGLNLTWESLEGVVKHNGPLLDAAGRGSLPAAIAEYAAIHDLELQTYPGPEAQVAALADDIAYNNHDIDDGLRAGLFTVEDLFDVSLVGPVFQTVVKEFPTLDTARVSHEAVRRLITMMVNDLIRETERRISESRVENVNDVRQLNHPLVSCSQALEEADRNLKAFLYTHMYRHDRVKRMTGRATDIVSALFQMYMADPSSLPMEWQGREKTQHSHKQARRIADFIAGMTDRFALAEYQRIAE